MIRSRKPLTRIHFPTAIVLCVSLLLAVDVFATQPRKNLGFAGIGWTAGGDTFVATPERENSSSGILNPDNNLSAGGDIHVWFGTIWALNRSMETFFAIGYHNDSRTFQGGSSNFGQITYDIVPTYRLNNFRFGTGISYHTNIRHSETLITTTDGISSTRTKKIIYQDALGTIISFGYDFSQRGRIDLRYQFIEYVTQDGAALAQNKKLNGDSLGLYVYVTF